MEVIISLIFIIGIGYMLFKMYTVSQSQEYKDLKEEYIKDYENRKKSTKYNDSTIVQSNTSSNKSFTYSSSTTYSNPSTGLPMSNGIGGVDVSGNSYGINKS